MTIAIIGGKRYNTATAEFVAEWSNNLGCSDFRNCDEALYRTKNGAWFTCGSGGPLSRYARPVGNGRTGSCDVIRQLSADEALEWLENHRETDAIERYFAAVTVDA